MAAGLATFRVLERDDGWARLEALGARLAALAEPILAAAPAPARLVRIGSIFWLSLQPGEPPRAAEDIDPGAAARYARVFHALLNRGVALAPSSYEVGFLSLAHQEEHLVRFAEALEQALNGPRESA